MRGFISLILRQLKECYLWVMELLLTLGLQNIGFLWPIKRILWRKEKLTAWHTRSQWFLKKRLDPPLSCPPTLYIRIRISLSSYKPCLWWYEMFCEGYHNPLPMFPVSTLSIYYHLVGSIWSPLEKHYDTLQAAIPQCCSMLLPLLLDVRIYTRLVML